MEAVAAGATGYLQKHSGKETLLRTLREVASGEYTIPADVIRRVFAGVRAGRPQKVYDPDRLTLREREILTLFAQGKSYAKSKLRRSTVYAESQVSVANVGPRYSGSESISPDLTIPQDKMSASVPNPGPLHS